MRIHRIVLCAALALPFATMAAQRGRGGGGDAGGGSTLTPEQAARLRSQQQALASIGAQLRERRVADLAESLALLTADQAEKAREFVNEQNDEFDKVVPGRR